jgi:hypothetical protein
MNFNHLGVVFILYNKEMCAHEQIIHFNPGLTQLFLHTFFLRCHSTFSQRCLLPAAAEMFDSST